LAISKCVVVGVTMLSASLAAAASAMELKMRSLVFLGDFAGGFGVRVVNAGEFNLSGGGEFGVNARVMLAERAGAEDGDFDFCHARSLPATGGNLNQKFVARRRRRFFKGDYFPSQPSRPSRDIGPTFNFQPATCNR
jgi:hypothetical protein